MAIVLMVVVGLGSPAEAPDLGDRLGRTGLSSMELFSKLVMSKKLFDQITNKIRKSKRYVRTSQQGPTSQSQINPGSSCVESNNKKRNKSNIISFVLNSPGA